MNSTKTPVIDTLRSILLYQTHVGLRLRVPDTFFTSGTPQANAQHSYYMTRSSHLFDLSSLNNSL